jgi:glucokinase
MGTASTLRLINRSTVFGAIRDRAPVSRAQIARLTSISAPTVSSIVADLLQDGYLRELPVAPSEGGRPPRLLAFSDQVAYVGCDLSASEAMHVGFVSLADEITSVRSLDYGGRAPDPERVVELMATEVQAWLDEHPGARIRGVGVGAPGATDVASGLVHWAPNLGWREVPLADLVARRLGVPAVVDNDVNLALLGEVNQGVATQARHAALVSFRDGVGGAVLIDGHLYRGRGDAGEVGYMVTRWPDAEQVHHFGSTERRLSELLSTEGERRGLDVSPLGHETGALVRLLLDANGELVVRARVRRALTESIAALLASIVALLDPEVIVLSGWIETLPATHLAEIEEAISRLVQSVPPLRISELGSTATLVGAGISANRLATELTSVVGAR